MEKQLARQDACFAINPGSNHETSIKISQEIVDLFGAEELADKEKKQVKFFIHKEDFIKSACGIVSSLPLYDKSGKFVPFSLSFYEEKINGINSFFEDQNVKLYSAELVYNISRSSCLQGFNPSFNIRNYTVESWSTISFEKKADGIHMRLSFSNNLSKDKELARKKRIERDDILQQIFYGAPGTGKSYIINDKTSGESVIRTTFHPDSDYSTFVGSYKPMTKEVPMRDVTGKVIFEHGVPVTEDRIVYEFIEQAFLKAYIKAWEFYAQTKEGNTEKQFLVIEEINRGNCAQIFGDLFQLLDRNEQGFSDYPISADSDMRRQLAKAFAGVTFSDELKDAINSCYRDGHSKDYAQQVLDGKILLLPNNFYIWATMNTSDQSLFPIDSAFKRRWDWQYMPISKGVDKDGNEMNWSIVIGKKSYDWWEFLIAINEVIGTETQSEDKKLGFFFCKADSKDEISADKFVNKVLFYLWNDVFKTCGKEYHYKDGDDEKLLTFDKFHTKDGFDVKKIQDWLELEKEGLNLKDKDSKKAAASSTETPAEDTTESEE